MHGHGELSVSGTNSDNNDSNISSSSSSSSSSNSNSNHNSNAYTNNKYNNDNNTRGHGGLSVSGTTSGKQRDPNPNKSLFNQEHNSANVEWNPLHVDGSFLVKELSLGLGSRCLPLILGLPQRRAFRQVRGQATLCGEATHPANNSSER